MSTNRITPKVERITPKKAEYLLRDNDHNRNLSQVVVDQYANAMRRGEWRENGASIVLSGRKLLDGQHRLQAVIDSNIPQNFVVVRGVAGDAFATVDTGNRRMLADVFSIENHKYPNVLAVAVNMHAAFTQSGQFRPRMRRHAKTYAELSEYLAANPQLSKSVAFVCSFKEKTLISKGSLGALHALFSLRDKSLANDYIAKIITGTNIRGKDPVKTVRQKLEEDALRRRALLSPPERCIVVALGWNATRSGKALKRIQVSARGQNKARTVEIE